MADRFEKFTERARQALLAAQSEAVARSQNYVGTEHLLLGLLRQADSTASKTIAGLGIHLEQIRQAASVSLEPGPQPGSAQIGLSPRAKKVVELAVDEARQLKHPYIGTEHILLGLVLEEGGIGGQILRTLGITMNSARAEVKRLVAGGAREKRGATTIDGRAIAAQVREDARERAVALHKRGITPGLALVLVGENPSSMSYVRSKGDAAEQAGLYSDTFRFAESTDQETVMSRILELNRDQRFHGILVQLPLPKHIREDAVMNCIDPAKDADGVTAANLGHLLRGEPCPWPATPAGVIELLHRTGNAPAGKHVVICGRSNIVGKPLAAILMQKNERANATVTMCHTGTPNLGYHTRQADILIAAMGVAKAITADMVKPGAVVIDVGNNWIEDASRKSGRRLVGDVDYDGVRALASAITPVPGGVGPMTVAMLISNTVWLAERYGNGE
jgi:methylenetetrahydrofolate dehydrogenase (NADP+)/methenyltetrahydrofolate cyclohydrolase